jgi:hypothetical protein
MTFSCKGVDTAKPPGSADPGGLDETVTDQRSDDLVAIAIAVAATYAGRRDCTKRNRPATKAWSA